MAAGTGRPGNTILVHATTVAHAGRAALIRGASGTGKSALALQLIALGARLVADDRTVLTRVRDTILADAPDALFGKIEARGIGILAAPTVGASAVALIVDMDTEETDRLPPHRTEKILDVALPVQRKVAEAHFPAAIMAYLEHGRID